MAIPPPSPHGFMSTNSIRPRPDWLSIVPPPPPPPPNYFYGEKYKVRKPMKYICTFGCGQHWQGHYIEIHAYDEESARAMMHEKFGNEWSMIYKGDGQHSAEEKAGVYEFKLIKLTNEIIKAEETERNKGINVIEGVY